MKKLSFLLTLLLSAVLTVSAQNVEFEAKNFASQKDAFKAASKELKEGNKIFEEGPNRYEAAIPHLLVAYRLNPNNADLNFKLGVAYLQSSFKAKALPYLQSAYQLNPRVDPLIQYQLGRGFHLNAKWDEALEAYRASLSVAGGGGGDKENGVSVAEVRKHIDECQTGKELMKKPVRVFIDNLGPEVNTAFAEYSPVITADEGQIYFTSRRDNTVGGKMDPGLGDYFEDIYSANHNENGTWTAAKNAGKPLNSENHDATVGISPDGQKLLVYLDQSGNGGDLYECKLEGNQWSMPENLGKRINTRDHEASASYAPDGNSLFFVSNKEEASLGGHDIYQIGITVKGKKQTAQNLGPVINTRYDEDAVFIHPDGKTMYFSSNGHNTMGGYDIFKSVYDKGKWSEPENLGWPINTPDDDVFFVISASGKHGYYSSARADGFGSRDIYRITLLGAEKPPVLSTEDNLLASRAAPVKEANVQAAVAVSTAQVTILKGVITDADTKAPLEADIEVVDNGRNEVIAAFKSNSSTGRYLVTLPSGVNYGIVVRKDGYLFHSENFDIPASSAFQEITKNVALNKLAVGRKIILRNIFFDFDKATLRPESQAELERVFQLMSVEVPKLKIELSGHTDDRGNAAYNVDLSQRRAKAVVDYLTKKGITADRLEFKGFGLTQPIVPNTSAANRQLNRRTEFKVLSFE